ncbi:MAG: formate dehydrogenase accessory sulfurtransferase FdhD [Ferruginibacter sp.]|nr:formate dehydrogenase accessory sulfurtransferase FdhD [Ferruginibacter sp.]
MKNVQAVEVEIHKIMEGNLLETTDQVAVEEPLEIQIAFSTATGRLEKNIAVTMRTPGNDKELAAGFLFTEGVLTDPSSIQQITHKSSDENRILVTLQENIQPQLPKTDRNFYSTSSCGICGKASIEAIYCSKVYPNEKDGLRIKSSVLANLPEALRNKQLVFKTTGGIHACALFDMEGIVIMMREDVGRHNALDKIVGASFLKNALPLNNCILLLSGRASFELLQKAAMAGIKIVAAIGAPSSLAVDMAKEHDVTLIGFLRNERFNIYSGVERVIQEA